MNEPRQEGRGKHWAPRRLKASLVISRRRRHHGSQRETVKKGEGLKEKEREREKDSEREGEKERE